MKQTTGWRVALAIVGSLLAMGCQVDRPAPAQPDLAEDELREEQLPEREGVAVRVVATGLDTPWALAFAGDGRLFFTERPARVRTCERAVQGISVGWGDVYDSTLDEQWIDLGPAPLEDGEYVLRSVVDPENRIHESPGGQDPERDGEEANEAIVLFEVRGGEVQG